MSKVQGLKKQFSERDVNRMRNLIQGKHGDKVGQSVGYAKSEKHYKEGDVWEVDGRKWTIKDGIKQNITKLDAAKKAHIMPIFCPCCGSKMRSDLDKPYWGIHKKCMDCVIKFEHELRTAGLYEAYEARIMNSDIDGFIDDIKKYVESQLTISNNSFITEQGDVEKWVGGPNVEKVYEGLAKTIEHLESLKK